MNDDLDPKQQDPKANPEDEEQDTEGHTMLPNMVFSQQAAVQRERDVRRNLQRHEFEVEARRSRRKEPKG